MNKIAILHPFTPQAAGIVEKNVPTYHSQPHANAMSHLAEIGFKCVMEYFTPRLFKYSISGSGLTYTFFPVDFKFNGDHKKWKKQSSRACLKAYEKDVPEVTIINMSGHSSPFSYSLSKLILRNKKQYIPMLGGRHYSEKGWVKDYYKNAHHILVHTELQKQEMLSMSLFKELDIRVFPLGIDVEIFKVEDNATNDKDINLLFVGRIVELKRIHIAIDVVSHLIKNGFRNIKLKIVGPTYSQEYRNRLVRLVEENNLKDIVSFEGFKDHSELPVYFNEADLFLLPSISESFGMVVVESMACGVPVAIIKGVMGPEEIITHNLDGIIASIDSYSDEILELLTNKVRLDNMKMNARKKILDKYSMEETTKVLIESVDDALNR